MIDGAIVRETWNAGRRVFRAQRLTTMAVALTLAFVLGMVICVFALVDGVLLQALPFASSERLVSIALMDRLTGARNVPYPLYVELASALETSVILAAVEFEDYRLSRGEWHTIRAAVVTTNLFDVLAPTVAPGRGFVTSDTLARKRSVILSHSAWSRFYFKDPALVGRDIRLSHRLGDTPELYTVVGITHGSIASPGGQDVEVFIAEAQSDASRLSWVSPSRYVVGRLAPGASPQGVQMQAEGLVQRLADRLPGYNLSGVVVQKLRDRTVQAWRPRLRALFVTAILVLGLVCANIGTLLAGIGRDRRNEFATRVALGATRPQVVRQVLLENVVMAMLGGCLAIWLAALSLPVLLAWLPGDLPRAGGVQIDWRAITFGLAAALCCGVFFGLSPALALSRGTSRDAFGETTRASRRLRWWTDGLLALQLAMAIGLTASAAHALLSEWRLAHAPVGFTTANVLVAELSTGKRIKTVDDFGRFQDMLSDAAQHLPGVTQVAMTDEAPPSANGMTMLTVGGNPSWGLVRIVSGSYFDTLDMPMLFGRTRHPGEAPRGLAVVNAALARRWFARDNAVGQSISFGDERLQIIGVVRDAREWSLREAPRPTLYRFSGTGWSGPMATRQYMLVRTRLESGRSAALLREQLRRLDPDLPVEISRLDNRVALARSELRLYGRLLLLFTAVTVLVAGVGISASVKETIARRRREIAIRIALGDTASGVRRLLLLRVFGAAAGSIPFGVWLAHLGSTLLGATLYGLHPGEPVLIVAATLMLIGVMAVATYGPIRAASGETVASVLRGE